MIKLINLLKEIGNLTSKIYSYSLKSSINNINKLNSKSIYEFTTDSGLVYDLNIENKNKYLDIDFIANKIYNEVNKEELFKVMSTITTIINNIINKGEFLGIRYESKSKGSDSGNKRDNLYRAYISKSFPGIKFIQQGGTIFSIFPK